MRLAARSRADSSFRASAGALGVLFARTWERADGIYRAMLARGLIGRFPSFRRRTFRHGRRGIPADRSGRCSRDPAGHYERDRGPGPALSYPDGTQALDGVDFHLEAGECVALFGANGSGKTTFVLHLNGLLSKAKAPSRFAASP